MDALSLILALLLGVSLILLILLVRKLYGTDSQQTRAIQDLERRMTDLLLGQSKELGETSRAMHGQIFSFAKETSQLKDDLKLIQETMQNISSFQEIFRAPKLRGEWGEANLEHLLQEYFPRELYSVQHMFSSGERVDAVLHLPNGTLLPIDSKFPLENFSQMIHAQEKEEKQLFSKKFTRDVQSHIDSVASKYIVPGERTTDFALLYVPAEAVFYHMMFELREEHIAEYARKRKIILVSPNTIYLTLGSILHWFKDTQISKKTADILRKLSRMQTDTKKLDEDFRKLGSHLKNASAAYENSEKRLSLLDERMEKLVQIEGSEDSSESPPDRLQN